MGSEENDYIVPGIPVDEQIDTDGSEGQMDNDILPEVHPCEGDVYT